MAEASSVAAPAPENSVTIRAARRSDAAAISEVCYRTGFMGEDLRGTGRFDDQRLFALLFCLYYVRFETEHCFVAELEGKVVGYIIGTGRAESLKADFDRRMLWRVALRLFAYTSWSHPGAFREVLRWSKGQGDSKPPEGYRAHLHINILPGYQRRGIGSGLMAAFTEKLKAEGHERVYLETSNHNLKGLPFYRKHGFEEIWRGKQTFWSGVDDLEEIVMGLQF
jgi:ribosomal protein S18 acetylase RimI-like enzyme